MRNILYQPSTSLLLMFTSLQTGFASICFRCMIVQNMEWENSCLLIFLLVTGERIKVHVMKISFKHGWFSHRARSSNFRIHLVTASAQYDTESSSEISDKLILTSIIFQIFQNVYVRAVGLAACCVVAMIEVKFFQIHGCLTFHEKQVTQNPKATPTTPPISSQR